MRRFLTILLVVYLSNTTYSQTISLKEQVITIPKNQISNLPTKIKVTGGTDNVYAYIKDIYVKVRLYQFTIDNYTLNSGRNMLLADNGNLEVFISLHPYAEHNGQQKSFSDINQENKEYIYLDLSHNIQVSIYGNKFTPKLDAFLIPVSNPTSTVKTGATLMGVYSSLYKSSTLAEANSKYKAGVNCTARVLRATLSTNSFAPNNWNSPQEKETYSLKIETKTDDDFWNSPTKAIAESKKTNSKTSKDDFWNNPTKTTAENKTTSTKTSDDDFWNNPTKTISENKQTNDDDFWNNPTKTIKEPKSNTSSAQSGNFTDSRDGQTYRWVKIGEQIWMAENLRYAAAGSKTTASYASRIHKTERLYTYKIARNICPSGWHLPTPSEWSNLTSFVTGDGDALEVSGKVLKSASGWNNKGTDKYGFAALPCGMICTNGSLCFTDHVFWWEDLGNTYKPKVRLIKDSANALFSQNLEQETPVSVRCIKNK